MSASQSNQRDDQAPPPQDPEAEGPSEQDDPDADDADQNDEDPELFKRLVIRRDVKKRIDVYLQQRLKGISRSKVQTLIDLGSVTVNEQVPKRSTVVSQGDVIEVTLPRPAIREIIAENIPVDILYEDDDFVVVNKDAGIIVHPARSVRSGTLINALVYHFQKQHGKAAGRWQTSGFAHDDAPGKAPGKVPGKRHDERKKGPAAGLSKLGTSEMRPGVIHRLDKNTTGVMVVGKSDFAHWHIANQFQKRETDKAYLAVVHGQPPEVGAVIDQPIGKHPTYREAYAVRHDSAGKASVTIYRVRERYAGFALVECELKTGRTHQIRVHLSYIGHPLVGDITYGGEPLTEADLDDPPAAGGAHPYLNFARDKNEGDAMQAEAQARADVLIGHPGLHATYLSFVHPQTEERVVFTAPVHERLRRLIALMRQRPYAGDLEVAPADGCWIDLAKAVPRPAETSE